MVGRQKADIADTLHLRDVVMATTLAFYIWRAHCRHIANTIEPSMCGGDATLCQITLTTCYYQRLSLSCHIYAMTSDQCPFKALSKSEF